MEAKLTTFHVLSMTPRLKRLQNRLYNEVLAFTRFKTHNPQLQDLTKHQELEALCDVLLLVRSKAIEVEYTDCLLGSENEGIILKLNMT